MNTVRRSQRAIRKTIATPEPTPTPEAEIPKPKRQTAKRRESKAKE